MKIQTIVRITEENTCILSKRLVVCLGSLRGGKLSLVHTVRACTRIYGKESVNVFMNDLSQRGKE